MRPKRLYLRSEAITYLKRTYPNIPLERIQDALTRNKNKEEEITPKITIHEDRSKKNILKVGRFKNKPSNKIPDIKPTRRKRPIEDFWSTDKRKYQFQKILLDEWANDYLSKNKSKEQTT